MEDRIAQNTTKDLSRLGSRPTGHHRQRKPLSPECSRSSSTQQHRAHLQGGTQGNGSSNNNTMDSNFLDTVIISSRRHRHSVTTQHLQHHRPRRRSSLLRRRARHRQRLRPRRRLLQAPSHYPASNRTRRKSTFVFAMLRTSRPTTYQRTPPTSAAGKQ